MLDENAYIVYNEFVSNVFDYHFHSYVVTPTESLSLINLKALYNYLPLHIRNSYNLNDHTQYIILKNKPCCTNDNFGII
jgi:hypothetical protein